MRSTCSRRTSIDFFFEQVLYIVPQAHCTTSSPNSCSISSPAKLLVSSLFKFLYRACRITYLCQNTVSALKFNWPSTVYSIIISLQLLVTIESACMVVFSALWSNETYRSHPTSILSDSEYIAHFLLIRHMLVGILLGGHVFLVLKTPHLCLFWQFKAWLFPLNCKDDTYIRTCL